MYPHRMWDTKINYSKSIENCFMSVYRHVYVYVCIYTYIYMCAWIYRFLWNLYYIYMCAWIYTDFYETLLEKVLWRKIHQERVSCSTLITRIFDPCWITEWKRNASIHFRVPYWGYFMSRNCGLSQHWEPHLMVSHHYSGLLQTP